MQTFSFWNHSIHCRYLLKKLRRRTLKYRKEFSNYWNWWFVISIGYHARSWSLSAFFTRTRSKITFSLKKCEENLFLLLQLYLNNLCLWHHLSSVLSEIHCGRKKEERNKYFIYNKLFPWNFFFLIGSLAVIKLLFVFLFAFWALIPSIKMCSGM